jgi:diguanylate cyclase (GGDEF)-like protein
MRPPYLKHMDILIVEDNVSLQQMLTVELESMGYVCHIAASGEECLHLIESERGVDYGLVLMDVDMSGLSGFETTRLLREAFPDQWIPVIFLTSRSDDICYAEGIEAGGDDYLSKPVNTILLKAKVKSLERFSDIQKKMNRLNKELEYMSVRDGLTQLLNRRAFDDLALRTWREAEKRRQSCAVLMLDVDYFKQYNDTYGHLEGDQCLLAVGRILETTTGDRDMLLARYGGEEFILVVSGYSQAEICSLAEQIRRTIEDAAIEHRNSGVCNVITVSIGVSISHHLENHTLNELIAAADNQLYRAKNGGRNQVAADALDSHKTILIGVTDAGDGEQLSNILSPYFNIVTADTGVECIEIASYIEPDLIIVCPRLTDGRGKLASTSFKHYDCIAEIPVLCIRNEVQNIFDASPQIGIGGFLDKPFVAKDVQESVTGLISGFRRSFR